MPDIKVKEYTNENINENDKEVNQYAIDKVEKEFVNTKNRTEKIGRKGIDSLISNRQKEKN